MRSFLLVGLASPILAQSGEMTLPGFILDVEKLYEAEDFYYTHVPEAFSSDKECLARRFSADVCDQAPSGLVSRLQFTQADAIILHELAFGTSDNELFLLACAIKYAAGRGKNVHIICGRSEQDHANRKAKI